MSIFYFRPEPRESADTIAKKKAASIEKNAILQESKPVYKSLEDMVKKIEKLNWKKWNFEEHLPEFVKLTKGDNVHAIPLYTLYIDRCFVFSLHIQGWVLPINHNIYKEERSLQHISLPIFLTELEQYGICAGISCKIATNSVSEIIKHCVPKLFHSFPQFSTATPLWQSECYRSKGCQMLIELSGQCLDCQKEEKKHTKELKRKHDFMHLPAKLNAPITKTAPERVKLTLQQARNKNKILKANVTQLKAEIEKSAIQVDKDLGNDIREIMKSCPENFKTPFMQLFWEEQESYLGSSKSGIRFHPQIIRFCLNLASKSPAAYDELQYDEKTGSGVLVLPSKRRLRDYKNYIRPQRGFNAEIIQELKEKTVEFSEVEKYCVLLLDEMKIQENLVWDKHSGELIGFVDLGDISLNYSSLAKMDEIATHVLVFLIRSIVNPFKFSLANFATVSATSSQLFPLFWKAVGILELQCKLKVSKIL